MNSSHPTWKSLKCFPDRKKSLWISPKLSRVSPLRTKFCRMPKRRKRVAKAKLKRISRRRKRRKARLKRKMLTSLLRNKLLRRRNLLKKRLKRLRNQLKLMKSLRLRMNLNKISGLSALALLSSTLDRLHSLTFSLASSLICRENRKMPKMSPFLPWTKTTAFQTKKR